MRRRYRGAVRQLVVVTAGISLFAAVGPRSLPASAAPAAAQDAGKPWSHEHRADYDRFEVRPGDRWSRDKVGVERSELRDVRNWPFSTDVWVAYSMRVPTTSSTAAPWTVVGQFHGTEDVGDGARSPMLAVDIGLDRLRITTRSDAAPSTVHNPREVERYRAKLDKGHWHSFVFRLRFARSGDGYLAAWMDGISIIPGEAIPLGYNDAIGPYWKYGVYRPAAQGVTTVEYANMEVSTTSLERRVKDSAPTPLGFASPS